MPAGSQGMPLAEALRDGLDKRIRPLTMTCLTAIFGMLPAAFSTQDWLADAATAGDRRRGWHDSRRCC